MSKKRQRRKAERRSAEEARKITPGKMVRLLLKLVAFAILLTAVVKLFMVLGVAGLGKPWARVVLVFGTYLLAYPVLMSEFRPGRKRRGTGEEV